MRMDRAIARSSFESEQTYNSHFELCVRTRDNIPNGCCAQDRKPDRNQTDLFLVDLCVLDAVDFVCSKCE